MVMAAMGAYTAALRGTAAGFSGILCHVLEFSENHGRRNRRPASGWTSGSLGTCPMGIYRKKILLSLYIVLMLFPFQILMLSEYLILNRMGLMDTLWALILPGAFSTFPIFILYRFFSELPGDVIEAAKLDGANEWQIFRSIGIPMGMPGIMAVIVLAFLEYWNLIEQPAVFLQSDDLKPLSLYISTVTRDSIGLAFAAAFVALLPPMLVFLCGRKYLEKGIAATAIKD